MDNDIRLIAIGEVERLPRFVREPLDALIADSAGTAMMLCLALSYGGREAIVARRARCARRPPPATRLTRSQSAVRRAADPGLPPLDLLIRTSGEQRISNFLLWEAAYAELLLHRHALARLSATPSCTRRSKLRRRERRFGLTSEQIRSAG